MSAKTGRKPTGRKPETVKRHEAKAAGAFGKETIDRVVPGEDRNEDNAVRRRIGNITKGVRPKQ